MSDRYEKWTKEQLISKIAEIVKAKPAGVIARLNSPFINGIVKDVTAGKTLYRDTLVGAYETYAPGRVPEDHRYSGLNPIVQAIRKKLRAQGYDCTWVKDKDGRHRSVIVKAA